MKSFKKVAVTILAAVMMLLISTTVFAADSPVKTLFVTFQIYCAGTACNYTFQLHGLV